MQDCNDALVKIRLAFRHVQPELPADGATAALAAVTLPDDDGAFGDGGAYAEHEVELLLLGGGGGGMTASMTTSAALAGRGGPACSDGAFDMMEVDVLGLGSQGEWACW